MSETVNNYTAKDFLRNAKELNKRHGLKAALKLENPIWEADSYFLSRIAKDIHPLAVAAYQYSQTLPKKQRDSFLETYQTQINGVEFFSPSFYQYTKQFSEKLNDRFCASEPTEEHWRATKRCDKLKTNSKLYATFVDTMAEEGIVSGKQKNKRVFFRKNGARSSTALASYNAESDKVFLVCNADYNISIGSFDLSFTKLAVIPSYLAGTFAFNHVLSYPVAAAVTVLSLISSLYLKQKQQGLDPVLGIKPANTSILDKSWQENKSVVFHEAVGHALQAKVNTFAQSKPEEAMEKYGFTPGDHALFEKSDYDYTLDNETHTKHYTNNVQERLARYAELLAF